MFLSTKKSSENFLLPMISVKRQLPAVEDEKNNISLQNRRRRNKIIHKKRSK